MIIKEYYSCNGLNDFQAMDDLPKFLPHNLANGLNNHVRLDKYFKPLDIYPTGSSIKPEDVKQYEAMTREELRKVKKPPLFQMLHLVLGYEDWRKLFPLLKERMDHEVYSSEMLEDVANEVSEEPLDWFFDYWLRTGTGFPSYRINNATAEAVIVGDDEHTEYKVYASITNVGTGRMPIPVQLRTAKLPINDKLWIAAGETVTWETTTKYLPKGVNINSPTWIMTAPYWDEDTSRFVTWASFNVEIVTK